MSRRLLLKFMITALLMPAAAFAEQSKSFGDYTIHYSAFTTDTLSPEVAKQYQIPRSKNRAMVNISILKKDEGLLGKPVRAKIEGAAKNLSEQLRALQIREVVSEDAVYYIAETPIANQETLRYDFEITPEGEQTAFHISFQEQFYTN
jgi:hypothetical protein